MNELESSRLSIGEIDKQIAELFCHRMENVAAIAKYKKSHGLPVVDPTRESALFANNSAYVKEELLPYYETFMNAVLAVSKRYQKRLIEGMKIAYCGVTGAFANIAARRIFPDGIISPYSSFRSAYGAVVRGEADAAVLPIENSYAGEVGQVHDLMFSGTLYVNGVYDLPVTHHLLAPKGAAIEGIKTVLSHPQALSQCENYIKKHGFVTAEATNTALAAKTVAEKGDPTVAAIASEETAQLYGLTVLDHDINDSNTNTTRFAVFTRLKNESSTCRHNNFLLMFTVKNVAGALARAISIIGEHGFNMRVLRSRPMRELAWQYYFYIEAEGNPEGEDGERMLSELSEFCDRLKVVGGYESETTLEG